MRSWAVPPSSLELPKEKVEQDTSKVEKLILFREKAMTNRLASIWKTSDELTGQMAIAIMRVKSEIVGLVYLFWSNEKSD